MKLIKPVLLNGRMYKAGESAPNAEPRLLEIWRETGVIEKMIDDIVDDDFQLIDNKMADQAADDPSKPEDDTPPKIADAPPKKPTPGRNMKARGGSK